jgi:hypothetical protein
MVLLHSTGLNIPFLQTFFRYIPVLQI